MHTCIYMVYYTYYTYIHVHAHIYIYIYIYIYVYVCLYIRIRAFAAEEDVLIRMGSRVEREGRRGLLWAMGVLGDSTPNLPTNIAPTNIA